MQLEQKARFENIGKVQLPVGQDGSVSRLDVLLKIALVMARFHSLEKYPSVPALTSEMNHLSVFWQMM